MKLGASTYRAAAEIFIATVGMPQLYIEGNHRSGSIIASWVNLVNEKPPFVLTVENAVAFFQPAQEIKKFNKKSLWRRLTKLPKYNEEFKLSAKVAAICLLLKSRYPLEVMFSNIDYAVLGLNFTLE